MDIEEWGRWLGSPDSYPLRGVPNSQTQWKRVKCSCLGKRTQGRLAPETWRRSANHASVPRLWRHVHGALPQHGSRRQRDALEVGNRRWWPPLPATAADSHSETAGSYVYGPGRHTSDRLLSGRRKETRPHEYTAKY